MFQNRPLFSANSLACPTSNGNGVPLASEGEKHLAAGFHEQLTGAVNISCQCSEI